MFILPLQEIYYYVNHGNKVLSDDIVSEVTSVKGVDKGNRELVEAITGDGGPLAAGAAPSPYAANAEGAKALVEAMEGDGAIAKGAPKKKQRRDDSNAEPAPPKTWEEIL